MVRYLLFTEQEKSLLWERDCNTSQRRLPTTLELKDMDAFEDRLVSLVQADMSGVLAGVITGNGYREWIFYCSSKDVISAAWDQVSHNLLEPYPISIDASLDPSWQYFFGQVLPE